MCTTLALNLALDLSLPWWSQRPPKRAAPLEPPHSLGGQLALCLARWFQHLRLPPTVESSFFPATAIFAKRCPLPHHTQISSESQFPLDQYHHQITIFIYHYTTILKKTNLKMSDEQIKSMSNFEIIFHLRNSGLIIDLTSKNYY